MPEPPAWINALLLGFAVASAATWVVLWARRARTGSILPYEPRWPVPWGAAGGVLAAFVLMTALAESLAPAPPIDATPFSSDTFVTNALAGAALSVMLTVAATGMICATTGASRRDLGLPTSAGRFLSDCRMGLVAALASLLPVYAVQSAVVYGFNIPSQHPVVMRLLSDPNPMVLTAAFVSAVIAAPIFEEVAFRLLLQGWLERVEDRTLAEAGLMQMPEESDEAEEDEPQPERELDEVIAAEADNPFASPSASDRPKPQARTRDADPPVPPDVTFAGLPHGWAPIAVAGLLFAVAHLGHGADPAALFVLALMLGYLYQRTHRIVPCIVAHMAFNGFSLTLAYLSAYFA